MTPKTRNTHCRSSQPICVFSNADQLQKTRRFETEKEGYLDGRTEAEQLGEMNGWAGEERTEVGEPAALLYWCLRHLCRLEGLGRRQAK